MATNYSSAYILHLFIEHNRNKHCDYLVDSSHSDSITERVIKDSEYIKIFKKFLYMTIKEIYGRKALGREEVAYCDCSSDSSTKDEDIIPWVLWDDHEESFVDGCSGLRHLPQMQH